MDFPEKGKIQQDFLESMVFPFCGAKREDVIAGPGYGVDAAVIRLPGGQALAAATDPVSLIPTLGLMESAWLSVHLMASDIATTGLPPMFALFNLNLPPTLSGDDFSTYWEHISAFCSELGAAIIGGHTGRFEGQNSTVAGAGMMMAYGPENEMLTSRDARPGDDIIVTREAAIISTAILSLSFPETIRKELGEEVMERGQALFYQSSSVAAALAAVKVGKGKNGVTAMHDVTEGGVCGAIYEMAAASECGVSVSIDEIPVGEAQRKICGLFGIDPLYSVGAGSLVIACNPEKTGTVIDELAKVNIPAARVGQFREKGYGKKIVSNGAHSELSHPGEDPYWAAFYEAFGKGWK